MQVSYRRFISCVWEIGVNEHIIVADIRCMEDECWCKTKSIMMAAGAPKGKKRKTAQKGVAERTDRLDGMVAQYKQQLFGGAAGSKTVKSSMQRWFE